MKVLVSVERFCNARIVKVGICCLFLSPAFFISARKDLWQKNERPTTIWAVSKKGFAKKGGLRMIHIFCLFLSCDLEFSVM